ncbi:hypothetical protein TYRP_017566, partial [Tyrophagus putrescentiae]
LPNSSLENKSQYGDRPTNTQTHRKLVLNFLPFCWVLLEAHNDGNGDKTELIFLLSMLCTTSFRCVCVSIFHLLTI